MKAQFEIQNLKCHGCANSITSVVSKITGISEVRVNHDTKEIFFNYLKEEQADTVIRKLSELGYPKKGEINSLPTKAKSYVSCAIGRITH